MPNNQVQFSLDGVSESKSTNISLDVYSCHFTNCKNIYPLKIVRPLKRKSTNNRDILDTVVDDVQEANLVIEDVIADNPKRAIIREAKNHASNYSCEYCHTKGTQFKNNVAGAKKQCHVVWPASSKQPENERQLHNILDIVELIQMKQNGEYVYPLSPDHLQGFVGRSRFLDLDDFDFIHSIPTEYMHSLCLGLMKRLIELTFDIGEKRIRVTTRKLSSPNMYNNFMRHVKVPREFSRRARQLDFGVLKAQEFRNILLFFFPLILQCIQNEARERRLWLLLVYMIRACIVPDPEFVQINPMSIDTACQKFYVLFEQLFGIRNCTYSLHVICSHLLKMRQKGPLTFTSAFIFENFYGELRNSFVPGTPSPVKQMMETVILKRSLSHHCCQNTIFFSHKNTALECNNLIYTFENNSHLCYKIADVHDHVLYCYRLGKFPLHFPELVGFNWALVGIYKQGALGNDLVEIRKRHVAGKLLLINGIILTCPNNILREK